jgi:hypothetical protein
MLENYFKIFSRSIRRFPPSVEHDFTPEPRDMAIYIPSTWEQKL